MYTDTVQSNTSMGKRLWGPTKKVKDSKNKAENLDDVDESSFEK